MRKPPHAPSFRSGIAALLLVLAVPAYAQLKDTAENVTFPAPTEYKDAKLTSRIVDAPNGTFGYEVYTDGKLLVQQQNVPGRSGWNGCPRREQAEKLAALVIDKIRHGIMPPTVSEEELKALGL